MLAGELVSRGANPSEAGYELYERETEGKLRLLQHFLASLRLEAGGRICVGQAPLLVCAFHSGVRGRSALSMA